MHDRPNGRGSYSHANCDLIYKGLFCFGSRTGSGVETTAQGRTAGKGKKAWFVCCVSLKS